MNVQKEPLVVNARIIRPPALQYGLSSKEPKAVRYLIATLRLTQTLKVPEDGVWTMNGRRLHKPVYILSWIIVIYERPQRFNDRIADRLVRGLLDAFKAAGGSQYRLLYYQFIRIISRHHDERERPYYSL